MSDKYGKAVLIDELPDYLKSTFQTLEAEGENVLNGVNAINPLDLDQIQLPKSSRKQYAFLLLRRHILTNSLTDTLSPDLLLERALVYEALGYAELAIADAYVAYTLCETIIEGPSISDLEPVFVDGTPWIESEDDTKAVATQYRALLVLHRSAVDLGCHNNAELWLSELVETQKGLRDQNGSHIASEDIVRKDLANVFQLYGETAASPPNQSKSKVFGLSQRLVYPWNDHEPDRMSIAAQQEINTKLKEVAEHLEVKHSQLPFLQIAGEDNATEESFQLGLYATQDLLPGSTILKERSALTAIRPHGEALCDACGADMEAISPENRLSCPGCDIPFCSNECLTAASQKYHTSNLDDEETDEGYPPAASPFCPGSAGNDDIHTLGRAESSTTAEWDLYFLLLARTLQMAETQNVHPLDLFEIKYLWADFNPTPSSPKVLPSHSPRTLPYSLRHHVELPLQWFEILMHSRSSTTPYSGHWLARYDWWVIQTLFAKFRGVADAQLSRWTGAPELAAVHPLWCLANHSCDPNVTWNSSGVKMLSVREEKVWVQPGNGEDKAIWKGVKKGEQIWNHYTDVKEKDYRERRARLREVLGGDCRCERCVFEEKVARNDAI